MRIVRPVLATVLAAASIFALFPAPAAPAAGPREVCYWHIPGAMSYGEQSIRVCEYVCRPGAPC